MPLCYRIFSFCQRKAIFISVLEAPWVISLDAAWLKVELGILCAPIILFVGFSRQDYWSGLPFPSPVDHILSDLSTMTCQSWVAPHGMTSFHWVRQHCGPSVWSDWLVFCDYGFSVSAFWCPLATPTVLLGFLLGYLFTSAPAKWSRCSLPWMRGISSQLPLLTLNVE